MENRPLISIIMPAYQAARLITHTLNSILAQTYPCWELIVIDDQSVDGTADIVKSYQQKHPNINYHCAAEHCGKPSIVRNLGMTFARGSFITFMDADDVCYPDALAVLLQPLLDDPGLNASIAFPLVCDSELNPIEYSPYLTEDSNGRFHFSSDPQFGWEKLCRTEVNFSLCCTMFRRQVIDRLGPLDETIVTGEDYKYIVSLLLLGFEKVRFVPAYTFKYRTYLGSTTKTPENIIRHIDCYIKVSNWLFSLSTMPDEYRQYKGEHLALMLACLLASLCNMNRKDLAIVGLIKCSQLSEIPFHHKFKFFGKEMLRIITPSTMQRIVRNVYGKRIIHYFRPLQLTSISR